jgi:hypothetical protein
MVSCVEQGRWNYRSREFASGKSIFRASSRKVQKQSTSANLRREGVPRSDQGLVWDEVGRSLHECGIHSPTADYQRARGHVSHRIEEFVEAIRPVTNQAGAVFYNSRGIIGAELLVPNLFDKCIEKIVRSFAYEALTSPLLNGASPEPAMAWWRNVLDAPFTRHGSIGVGDDIRTAATDIIGSGLVYGGAMIHFSCFPNAQPQGMNSKTQRSSVRERKRNLRSNIPG